MEYIIKNLTQKEIDIMESSDIEWFPDDVFFDSSDIVIFSEKDRNKAVQLIGRK